MIMSILPRHPISGGDSRRVGNQIRHARELFGCGRRAAALRTFETLRELYPDDASVWLESAFALDRLGREAQAIPLYEQAIALGLNGSMLKDALVCLGSSLRTVGRSREAVRFLTRAHKQFPEDIIVELFLALAYHDIQLPTRALRLVATACLRDSKSQELAAYRGVLKRKYRSLGGNGRIEPKPKSERAGNSSRHGR
jgi:Flp pilus assembly protein TadD